MDQGMIADVIDALSAKNRTVKGWTGKVSLADLGYAAAGIDEGWVSERLSAQTVVLQTHMEINPRKAVAWASTRPSTF